MDMLEGKLQWREDKTSDDYDYELLEAQLLRLRELRKQNDIQGLLFTLQGILHRFVLIYLFI